MKIKYIKHGYFKCNYPPGSIVEVEDNYGKYVVGMGDAELASAEDKITDPIPYVMQARKSQSEDALTMIANILAKKDEPRAERKA